MGAKLTLDQDSSETGSRADAHRRLLRAVGELFDVAPSGHEARDAVISLVEPALSAEAEKTQRALDAAKNAVSERDRALAILDAILSESPLALAFFDAELRFQRVNGTFSEISGLTEDDHPGRTLREVIPNLDPSLETLLRDVILGRRPASEREMLLKSAGDGDRHWVVHFFPLREDSSTPVGGGAVFLDVTERRRADEARQRSESQLRLALDATRMGLWFWNIESGDIRWSETNALLMGLDPLAVGSVQVFAQAIHTDDRDRVIASLEHTARTAEPYEETFRVVWPDDTVHWILAKGQAQLDDGDVIEMVGIHMDITESRAAQDERARLALRQTRAGEQAVRMQRVTAALSEALTVSQVCDVILYEGCAVLGARKGFVSLLSDDHQTIETMRMFGYDEAETVFFDDVDLSGQTMLTDTISRAKTVLLTDLEEIEANYPETLPLANGTHVEAIASLPLSAHGMSHGAWVVAWPEAREFKEGEIIILMTLAAQVGQALDRARMYERERLIATSLQRSLLPARLPTLANATTARRYLPSGSGVEIGGDWYDVLRFSDNRVALVIGDVGGHNIDSAAVMGQVRNAVRSYAWEGHPPGTVLEATNKLLCGLEPGVLTTCCYVELNLDDGIASVARAGHPPPLVIQSTTANFADIPADPPLGTDPQQKFEQSTLFLLPGDALVLYTDGLIETRAMSLEQGLQRLVTAAETLVAGHHEPSHEIDVEMIADRLFSIMTSQRPREDDLAILVLRYEPSHVSAAHSGGQRVIRRHLPSSAASAGVARRFAADVMDDWGVPELSDVVSLCISELVTNALIHTATDVELILRLSHLSVKVEVVDHSDRLPVVRPSSDDDTSGRGLQIVDAISNEWGVEPHRAGKSVWFQIDRHTTEHQPQKL